VVRAEVRWREDHDHTDALAQAGRQCLIVEISTSQPELIAVDSQFHQGFELACERLVKIVHETLHQAVLSVTVADKTSVSQWHPGQVQFNLWDATRNSLGGLGYNWPI
jgi:hypothetical protein